MTIAPPHRFRLVAHQFVNDPLVFAGPCKIGSEAVTKDVIPSQDFPLAAQEEPFKGFVHGTFLHRLVGFSADGVNAAWMSCSEVGLYRLAEEIRHGHAAVSLLGAVLLLLANDHTPRPKLEVLHPRAHDFA